MKWILPIFIALIVIYWATAKDRSANALIESIASDFRSKGPNPFEIEGFRMGHSGHRGHRGHSGHRGHRGGYSSGGNYGGSSWYWLPWYWPIWYSDEISMYP